jgi:hypothetical protein
MSTHIINNKTIHTSIKCFPYDMDYYATFDGYDGAPIDNDTPGDDPIGSGATEQEAIAELFLDEWVRSKEKTYRIEVYEHEDVYNKYSNSYESVFTATIYENDLPILEEYSEYRRSYSSAHDRASMILGEYLEDERHNIVSAVDIYFMQRRAA